MTPEKDEPTILHVPCEHCAARSTPAEATWDDSDGYVDNIYGDQPTPAEALDLERFRRYEEHVGGLHCPEWHAESCEWQERCDEPGCTREATAGFPTPEGYRRTCSEHVRWKK